MTSPTVDWLNSQIALDMLMPTQPWLTLARPWLPVDHGAACTNSPLQVTRIA